ncbi:Phosphoribosylanthranilate isomerase [Novosphingobium nitrogenifigens DSM 19370]|uniref:N-(5'-phosphoribosyl)anthranilate isomerase n=1 Tax=Novosphingobium nitrogenifigens DSM 19370 TaxID=983920 RepID=F1Z859_9SPHN|nr:phosphoribosylanthranilate isomerase [Novosphingobium nitrogenifigens]EGD59166.1 Phosphoribosylanthranilate isomerase [Novosphingobium nitrogenifigens DSM 19370]
MAAPLVKICGINDSDALDATIRARADFIGLVFFAKSPRHVEPDKAAMLAARSAGRTTIVGLFVDPEPDYLARVMASVPLDRIQLHGKETPAQAAAIAARHGVPVWKALGVKKREDLLAADAYAGAVERVLFDAKPPEGADLPGGTGLRIDWAILKGARPAVPWMLAGGLDPLNVAEALSVTGAPAVDVSSGVEQAPGVKDAARIAAFCAAARGA